MELKDTKLAAALVFIGATMSSKKQKEKFGWVLVHNCIAHPLMAVTLDSKWSVKFHDWTATKAWPRHEA